RQSAISMSLSEDGKTLIAFSYYYPKKNGAGQRYEETLITAWDAATRKQLLRRRHPVMDSWTALSADARVLAVPFPHRDRRSLRETPASGAPVRQALRLQDLATREPLLTFPTLTGQTWPLAFSSDGLLLASNNADSSRRGKKNDPARVTGHALHLWEVATG